MKTAELIIDAALFGGTIPKDRVRDVEEYLKEAELLMQAKKQGEKLNIPGVSGSLHCPNCHAELYLEVKEMTNSEILKRLQ